MLGGFVPDPVFEANPKQVAALVRKIHDGELALPDFQRDFVWEPRRTADLIRTIMSRYPAGSLLFWRLGGDNAAFAARAVEGAPPLTHHAQELILDGQQRLTALYQSLAGVGEETYYINLSMLITATKTDLLPAPSVDWEEAVMWFDSDSQAGALAAGTDWQWDNCTLPVQQVHTFDAWLDGFVDRQALPDAEEEKLKALYRSVRDRYLFPLITYGFPVVTLPDTTPIVAVCTVFETLNSTGKPLGAFELLTARFYPENVNLRELWVKALDDYPILETFDIDPYGLLQSVCLRAHGSAQRSDVLGRLTAADVTDHWLKVVAGAAALIDVLSSSGGVLSPKYLPYTVLLVPMSAIWEEIRKLQTVHRASALERLERFFWCSVFTSNYDQGANSQAGADYQKLKEWLFDSDKPAPEAIAGSNFNATALRVATVRHKALYNGVLALTVKMGAKDFHTALTLTRFRMEQDKIESHHIFPKAYLRATGNGESSELILNRALIDRETNRIISNRAPSVYVAEMSDAYGAERLLTVLESHLIGAEPGGHLVADDYEGFLDARCSRLLEQIHVVTGWEVGSTKDEPGVVSDTQATKEA